MMHKQSLDSLCLIVADCPHSTPKWTDSGVCVLGANNVKNGRIDYAKMRFTNEKNYLKRIKRAVPRENDIVITREAPMGEVCLVPGELKCCLGQRVVLLRVDPKKASSRFVFYALQSPGVQHQISWNEGTGSTVSNLRIPHLKELQIPSPAIETQKAIAHILGTLDDKIELNRRMNEALEAMAQALFKSWFVDFDPVKAKMEGRQPEGMDAETAALFPDKLVESELGLIPEGWKLSTVGQSFKVTMGQSPKGETLNESGEGIVFFQGRKDFGFRYPANRIYTTDPKRFANAGDSLISVRAPVGDKNMAFCDCCIGRGVAALRHLSESCSYTYAFISHIEEAIANSGSTGTVFNSINKNQLLSIACVEPSSKSIAKFEAVIGKIDKKIENLHIQSESLKELRDTLLPKLLSGELSVAEFEEQLESVL